MTTLVLVGLGAVLVLSGVWGRRNAESLGAVPGMPDDHVHRRTAVMRRGATTCVAVGVVFVVLGVLAPLL